MTMRIPTMNFNNGFYPEGNGNRMGLNLDRTSSFFYAGFNNGISTTRLFSTTSRSSSRPSSNRMVNLNNVVGTKNGNANNRPPGMSTPPISANSTPKQATTNTNTKNSNAPQTFSDKVTIIDTMDKAKHALKVLESHPDAVWACDTEVEDIDLKTVGPVGNGHVTCISIFGGPDIDFGLGEGPGTALWIDNIGPAGELIRVFKEWFESTESKKVWHNYGFDRHIMNNEEIMCKGFYGDTFHMARLWDTSRDKQFGGGNGYSLEGLSDELVADDRLKKVTMKELFGQGKEKKDGSVGKVKVLPPIRELQENPAYREDWIEYSAKDAIATWLVYRNLESKLTKQKWSANGNNRQLGTMMDFYRHYLCDFGELLTDMEAVGIKVDTTGHLKQAEAKARQERADMEERFLKWAALYCEDAALINTASSVQVGQFLFGHYKEKKRIAKDRIFKIDKTAEELAGEQQSAEASNPYLNYTAVELKALLKERKLKVSGKKGDLIDRLMAYDAMPVKFDTLEEQQLMEMCVSRGLPHHGTKEELADRLTKDSIFVQQMANEHDQLEEKVVLSKPKKWKEITITTLGLDPIDYSPAGTPQVSATVLRKLAGTDLFGDEKDAVWGKAYKSFLPAGEEKAKEACRALGALASIGQIDATITNFLVPLQALVDKKQRIHCSLNLNTETGRLSSRRPNLQNQPALEKDNYRIRDAFVAEEGNTLIVADYGQLELRLMAHMTKCASMLQAFKDGGCFHSRTALGMYPYIRDAVEAGDCLLEWDYGQGQPTVPLVKDQYGSERRKAKTLNFSIAYGKTVHGLAQDWGITTDEAQDTLSAWYNDRPEVKEWQDRTRHMAKKEGYVTTLMGRRRFLPEASGQGPAAGHALRAAINSPIQGSAADVVMMAMIKLWKSEVLKSIGWTLLLQIHDEVILEGPKEHRDVAMAEVIACMENPFDHFGLEPLDVHLDVDAKSADSWYKAK